MLRTILLMTCLTMLPAIAEAQELQIEPMKTVTTAPVPDTPSVQEYTSRVLALNQIDARQNPQFTLASKALSNRLLDQNRRALGKVQDISLNADGTLKAVEADVIATGFDQTLTFDVVAYNVTPETDAYSVTLTREQVENNIPEFLAGMDTASGEEGGQPITVQSLIGARVQTDKGTQVGIVDDVAISDQRKAAVALILTLMGGGGRTTIAVPYKDARIDRLGNKATVEISEDQAKVVSSFARKR